MAQINLALLVLGFLVAFATPTRVAARIASFLGLAAVLLFLVVAMLGIPIMRSRLATGTFGPPVPDPIRFSAHAYAGFVTEALFSFTWPSFLAVALHTAGTFGRLLRTISAALLLAIFVLVSISAYFLRHALNELGPVSPATVLRFVVFHATLGPAVVAALLGWFAMMSYRAGKAAG